MTTDPPPPRRNWHLKRWFTVLVIAVFAWSGWRVYDHRSAVKEAEVLGWSVYYTDPAKEIQAKWENAFRKKTWTDGVIGVLIPTSTDFDQHIGIVPRLNPKSLRFYVASTLRDLSFVGSLERLETLQLDACHRLNNVDALKNFSALAYLHLNTCPVLKSVDALKNLPALERIYLIRCTQLANVDGLKNLPALKWVVLEGCTGLKNLDGLKSLPALQRVVLSGCTGLTRESVEALRAALPNANIIGP